VELAFARVLDLDSDGLDRKLQFSDRVMRFAPTPVIAYQHAFFLALKGDLAQATQVLDRAVAIYPEHLERFRRDLQNLKAADRANLEAFLDRVERHVRRQQGAPTLRDSGG
jgi:hypothetical protein